MIDNGYDFLNYLKKTSDNTKYIGTYNSIKDIESNKRYYMALKRYFDYCERDCSNLVFDIGIGDFVNENRYKREEYRGQ